MDVVAGVPPPEDTPNEQTTDPQQPDLECTPDPMKMKAHWHIVGVENASAKPCHKATGLYNKHCKYSDQWNPLNLVW